MYKRQAAFDIKFSGKISVSYTSKNTLYIMSTLSLYKHSNIDHSYPHNYRKFTKLYTPTQVVKFPD